MLAWRRGPPDQTCQVALNAAGHTRYLPEAKTGQRIPVTEKDEAFSGAPATATDTPGASFFQSIGIGT